MSQASVGLLNFLIRDGLIDTHIGNDAIKAINANNVTVTQFLVQQGILSSDKLLNYCAKMFAVPIYNLQQFDLQSVPQSIITPDLIARYRVLPLGYDLHYLHLGITDPTNQTTLDAINFHTGLYIKPFLVDEDQLNKIISKHCQPMIKTHLELTLSNIAIKEQTYVDELELNDEPIIDFVDRLLRDAIDKQVSDIHIEPYENICRIRFRRDGILAEATTLSAQLSLRVITRIKVMANLNIAERRVPQDGRIQLRDQVKHTNKIDIRLNACPTLYGEKLVLRILDKKKININIDELGFFAEQKEIFLNKLMEPQGLILVTGPTGSGKTSTLYSALSYLNQVEKNISSVEDPIEIELNGVNQVNVNPSLGLDFAAILRTFLRQDPDIIMVGEIRDRETAAIAIEAAQTGHLVLSSLHTNSAVETFTRLQSLNVSQYNLLHSVSLIIAQRLIRKLCDCKQVASSQNDVDILKTMIYSPVGCVRCYHGYFGRIGIFELIDTEKMLSSLASGDNRGIDEIIIKNKHESLWQIGVKHVLSGTTSLAELKRVIGNHELYST